MKANITKTYTDFEGNMIDNPVEGQLGYCPETQQACTYKEGKWESTTLGLNMNTYDMNKQIIAQLDKMDEIKINEAKDIITELFSISNNNFYMLLCNELKYYTVFYNPRLGYPDDHLPHFADEVITCAQDLGYIKIVDKVEGAVEIWIQSKEDELPFVMYLFPYDGGVIECQK